jgi:hypothetical protein
MNFAAPLRLCAKTKGGGLNFYYYLDLFQISIILGAHLNKTSHQ